MKILFSNSEITLNVRRGKPADSEAVRELLEEHYRYEIPENTAPDNAEMLNDCFKKNSNFYFFVAEKDGKICGVLFYFIRFMSGRGRCLYIDDLIVNEKYHGLGAGNLLMDAAVKESLRFSANLISWQVTDWHEVAINFYRKFEGKFSAEQSVPA